MSQRNQVFISYSHLDKEWLDELKKTLKPYLRNRTINVWDDQCIQPGAQWKNEIEKALQRAKVAVLLVSRNFLASEFIVNHELPTLLDAAEKEGLVIIWICVGHCSYKKTTIAKYQAAYDVNRPLNSLKGSDLDEALVKIADKIETAILNPVKASVKFDLNSPKPQKKASKDTTIIPKSSRKKSKNWISIIIILCFLGSLSVLLIESLIGKQSPIIHYRVDDISPSASKDTQFQAYQKLHCQISNKLYKSGDKFTQIIFDDVAEPISNSISVNPFSRCDTILVSQPDLNYMPGTSLVRSLRSLVEIIKWERHRGYQSNFVITILLHYSEADFSRSEDYHKLIAFIKELIAQRSVVAIITYISQKKVKTQEIN